MLGQILATGAYRHRIAVGSVVFGFWQLCYCQYFRPLTQVSRAHPIDEAMRRIFPRGSIVLFEDIPESQPEVLQSYAIASPPLGRVQTYIQQGR